MEIVWFLLLSLMAGCGALITFLYFWKKGQFEESEETKYQIFREDD